MQVFIDTKQTSIEVRNNAFFIKNKTTNRIISPKRISSIAITSNAIINASAIKLAANNEIPIYYYNHTGGLMAQLISPTFLKHAKLRHQQVLFMKSEKGLSWAISQLILKTTLQIQTLKRASKENLNLKEKLEPIIQTMVAKKENLSKLLANKENNNNTIMGIEGSIARMYYKALNYLLPKQYQFAKRSRQPGADYFNTTLNYMYGITYGKVSKAIQASGLDMFMGALHTTPFKESLLFDSIEIFRPIIDRLLLQICKEERLQDKHFKKVTNGFWLSKEGKKLVIPLYSDYLKTRIKIENKVTSIENHIYLNSRKLKLLIQNQENHVPNTL
jgi:CRISPR-associated protein Cas1